MRRASRCARTALAAWITLSGLIPTAHAQGARSDGSPNESVPPILRQMIGTWHVDQRMWPGFGKDPVQLPPALAKRRLVGGQFLEEVMDLAPGVKAAPFTRVAYINYNTVNQQLEYASLDTRGPQMMTERSRSGALAGSGQRNGIPLYGGTFTAPQWGEARNVSFHYRLALGDVHQNRQVLQLYLTPAAKSGEEFLAFEYVYTRRE